MVPDILTFNFGDEIKVNSDTDKNRFSKTKKTKNEIIWFSVNKRPISPIFSLQYAVSYHIRLFPGHLPWKTELHEARPRKSQEDEHGLYKVVSGGKFHRSTPHRPLSSCAKSLRLILIVIKIWKQKFSRFEVLNFLTAWFRSKWAISAIRSAHQPFLTKEHTYILGRWHLHRTKIKTKYTPCFHLGKK